MTNSQNEIVTSAAAIQRGLDFIYRFAREPDNFDTYGNFVVCCFALVGATSRDVKLREMARERAHKLARRWQRTHPFVPPHATPNIIFEFLSVRYAVNRLGLRDPALSAQMRAAAKRFVAHDFLGFAPTNEPPPVDLSYTCDCGLENQRGRKFCKQCKRHLLIKSRYRVWMEALANTYIGEKCGVLFGAHYVDVLKWLPAMRPYPVSTAEGDEVRDALYAVTHMVYTLNDYGTYRLSPRWLPQEFAFLKANVAAISALEDPELLGELLDSLKAFGLRASHPLMCRGTKALLAAQNPDGSWGDADDENIRTRCHTTWTAVDGLRAYTWRGERVSFPTLKPLLKR
jgi:hypothetical protein